VGKKILCGGVALIMSFIFFSSGCSGSGGGGGAVGPNPPSTKNANLSWENLRGPFVGAVVSWTVDTQGNLYALSSNGQFFSKMVQQNDWEFRTKSSALPSTALISGPNNTLLDLGGGVYLSTDGGKNWTKVKSDGAMRGLISPAGTLFFSTARDLYRSTDQGKTWNVVASGDNLTTLTSESNGHLLLGRSSGEVMLSTDDGQTWQSMGPVPSGVRDLKEEGETVYAGTLADGVYASTDEGRNWSPLGLAGKDVQSVHPVGSGELYVLLVADHTVYHSTDNGTNWALVNTPDLVRNMALDGSGSPIVFVDTGNTDVDGLYTSADQGLSWQKIGIPGGMVLSMVENNSGQIFASIWAGDFRGVFRSDDGGLSWKFASAGLPANVSAYHLEIDSQGRLFAANANGIYRSTDNGASWTQLNLTAQVSGISVNSQDEIFAEADLQGVMRSQDHGDTWSLIYSNNNIGFGPMGITPDGKIYVVQRGVLYSSADDGQTWEQTQVTNGHFECSVAKLQR